jgi:hypothetical protein
MELSLYFPEALIPVVQVWFVVLMWKAVLELWPF